MFEPGDRVAWSHEHATEHAAGSVVRESAASSWPHVLIGTIVEAANETKTWWVVRFGEERKDHARFETAKGTHEEADCLTLTSHELVKIGED